jgi:hypothetical protein
MYQMYAYQKRYGVPRALLVYPAQGAFGEPAGAPVFRAVGDAEVWVQFWQVEGMDGPGESARRVFEAAKAAAPGDWRGNGRGTSPNPLGRTGP